MTHRRPRASRAPVLLAALAGCFIALLLYATMKTTSTPGGVAAERVAAAERACVRAVRERLPDARFPLAASVAAAGGGRYRLNGVVDAGGPEAAVRRNYECLLRPGLPGSYVADSVRVWQSH